MGADLDHNISNTPQWDGIERTFHNGRIHALNNEVIGTGADARRFSSFMQDGVELTNPRAETEAAYDNHVEELGGGGW